jgi:exopolyphosphatase / guanosine-5'-triphosphate,3'-diphosphate pyrophosphatase
MPEKKNAMITAALDIGSNSIHLVVVETGGKQPFRVLASAKEMVRLGRSVARDRKLSASATERALQCLKKFRARAEGYGATEFVAVATSAVREAANRADFIQRAAAETGVQIELLSGVEEARLIALAVSVRVREHRKRRLLVIDIGGGSTEFAVAVDGEPLALASLKLGAVRFTESFMSSDPIPEKQLRRMRAELREVIAPRAGEITAAGFELCFGTSGTINALGRVALARRARKRTTPERAPLTLDGVRALNEELARLDLEERVKATGLSRARAEIIVAGGQILEAAMELLGVAELSVCDYALREGVIISRLAQRAAGRGVAASAEEMERDPSLRGAFALLERYRGDRKHARRVAHLAGQLFDELQPLHLLGGEQRRLLTAAALLHDIGYFVSHTGHHKHSAYLIQHSDLTGFTAHEIAVIANVARYHRSSPPKAKHPYFTALAEEDRAVVRQLAALLRVADALDRDHAGRVRNVKCEVGEGAVRLTLAGASEEEAARWRVEERGDLFAEVYGRPLELAPATALAAG